MARRQIEERIFFTREQKTEILSKSTCKCSRCGKALTVDDMTVEHIVPLSKGGTNDIKNLVALCYNCNQDKGNYILHPLDYYGYVNKEYIPEIEALFEEYLTEVPWYGRRNYTKEDKKLFYYKMNKIGSIRKLKNGNYMANYFRQCLTFERVYIDDIDEIYAFVREYNDKYEIKSDGLRSYLEEVFNKGCIYKIYSKSSIVAVLPFTVEPMFTEDEDERYKLKLNGIPNKYQKEEYAGVIAEAIDYVMHCLSELNYLGASICVMSLPKKDTYLHYIAQAIHGHLFAESGDWDYFISQFIAPAANNDVEGQFMYEEAMTRDSDKIEEIVSEGLERRLNLPSLKKKQEKAEQVETYKNKVLNDKKTTSKRKKPKKEYDEYDIEYYLK